MAESDPRIVAFCVSTFGLRAIRRWADDEGYAISLLATLRSVDRHVCAQLIAQAGATPVVVCEDVHDLEMLIRGARPDVGLVCTFAHLPQSITEIPVAGCVNLHPSLLPSYRGFNPFRSVYDAADRLGATLHRVTPELDGGPILAQSSRPLPDPISQMSVAAAIDAAMLDALRVGVPLALSGDPGRAQDHTAPCPTGHRFTEDERDIRWELSPREIVCRVVALCLSGLPAAATIDGRRRDVIDAAVADAPPSRRPGDLISLEPRRAIVGALGGAVALTLSP